MGRFFYWGDFVVLPAAWLDFASLKHRCWGRRTTAQVTASPITTLFAPPQSQRVLPTHKRPHKKQKFIAKQKKTIDKQK
jgi:hypothetical protein